MSDIQLEKRKVHVLSKARCATNQFDNVRIKDYIATNGLELVDSVDQADVVIFNSCAFTEHSENVSFNTIEEIKHAAKPGAQIVVTGCLPRINKARLEQSFDGDIVPASKLATLPAVLDIPAPFDPIRSNVAQPEILEKVSRNGRLVWRSFKLANAIMPFRNVRAATTRALTCGYEFSPQTRYVQISTGCQSNCTFCAIVFARGRTRSRPISLIESEIGRIAGDGRCDVALVSDDAGVYGSDIGANLETLLARIADRHRNVRLYLYQLNPRWVIDHTKAAIELAKSGSVALMSVPVQSGSSRILELMKRDYQAAEAREALLEIQSAAPSLCVTSHMIVGFPTETEDDFEQTKEFVRDVPFDALSVFRFAKKPRVLAAKLPEQIDDDTKLRRMDELHKTWRRANLKRGRWPFSFAN